MLGTVLTNAFLSKPLRSYFQICLNSRRLLLVCSEKKRYALGQLGRVRSVPLFEMVLHQLHKDTSFLHDTQPMCMRRLVDLEPRMRHGGDQAFGSNKVDGLSSLILAAVRSFLTKPRPPSPCMCGHVRDCLAHLMVGRDRLGRQRKVRPRRRVVCGKPVGNRSPFICVPIGANDRVLCM